MFLNIYILIVDYVYICIKCFLTFNILIVCYVLFVLNVSWHLILIVHYVLFVLNVSCSCPSVRLRVSFCLFARCLLSFFSPFEFPGARRPFLFILSLCWVIFSRLCICYLSFVQFLLFIYWLILRSSRLFVAVSLLTNVLWLCGFVTYVYTIRRKRSWVWCLSRARVDDDNSVFGCRFSRLTGWRRLCVGVVFDINLCVVYCWHCRVCWCVLFYVLFINSFSGYIPILRFLFFSP